MWGALSRHKGRVGQGWGSKEGDKGVPTALNEQTGRESSGRVEKLFQALKAQGQNNLE